MKRVLLVDDEQYVLDDLKAHVDWKGLEIGHIFEANSVKEALEIFECYEPELIISDIEMIGESGLDLLKQLQEQHPDKKARFVFLTCHPDFDYARQALRLGSDDYVLKPVDYGDFFETVARVLELKKGFGASGGDEGAAPGTGRITEGAKQYIREHLSSLQNVSDVAEALHISESTLMKAFKKDTGWGVAEYIAKERVANAGQLLKNTDWSIQMVAEMSGFNEQSYFSRVFKKITGMTPGEYRKMKRG